MSAHSVVAQEANTWQPFVGVTYGQDDNLFRLPDSHSNNTPIADTSRKLEAGTAFDKMYSKQHITASVDVNRTSFERFSFINYDGKEAQANWNWAAASDFKGNLGTSYSQSLTPYSQFHSAERNLRTQKRNVADLIWHLSPRWQLHGSTTNANLNYDLSSQSFGDRTECTTDFGIDYVSPKGNTIGLVARHDRGEFPNEQIIGTQSINNNYTQNELKANIDWSYSGITHIQFLGGWARREHDFFPVRDVSGPSVRLIANWMPTGKTSLKLTSWRDINAVDDLSVSYTVNKGMSLNPSWEVLPKVRLEGILKEEKSDFSGASVFTPLLPQNRTDTSRYGSLSAIYSPIRKVQVTAVLYTDQLKSSIPIFNYRAKGITLNVRVSF